MSDNDQTRPLPPQSSPEWVTATTPQRKKPRAWVIVVLALIAALIAAGAVWLLTGRNVPAAQHPSTSATATPTPTASSPAPTEAQPTTPAPPEPTAQPTDPALPPTVAPDATDAPDPQAPSHTAFTSAVGPRLQDAETGLRMLAKTSGQDAIAIVDQLNQDAMVLSDTVAPSDIGNRWNDAAREYISSLSALRQAYSDNAGVDAARDAASQKAQALSSLAK